MIYYCTIFVHMQFFARRILLREIFARKVKLTPDIK
jgi:hypothetical protein